jgi:quercetin dioxygenase-like cupin family protein
MSDSPGDHAASAAPDAAWSDDLDALVAAPDHHTLLHENDRVRVLDTCIRPGDQTPVHTHRWPAALYILSWSQFVRYDDKGTVLLDVNR